MAPSHNLLRRNWEPSLSIAGLRLDKRFDAPRKELQTILIEQFLELNLDYIKERENLLQHYFTEDKEDAEAALAAAAEDASVLLLAGHETTARLLQFTLILLSKHADILQRLREEIAQHQPSDGQWTKKDIHHLTFLTKIIKETLRLYPSAPLPRAILEDMVLADIPLCRNKQEYENAMAERDVSRDIVLEKVHASSFPLGTHIV